MRLEPRCLLPTDNAYQSPLLPSLAAAWADAVSCFRCYATGKGETVEITGVSNVCSECVCVAHRARGRGLYRNRTTHSRCRAGARVSGKRAVVCEFGISGHRVG